MIFWSRPEAFWLFVPVAAAAVAAVAHFRWKTRAAARLGDPALLKRLTDPAAPGRQRLKALLSVAALSLLALAVAGPRWGRSFQEVRRKGTDVVIVVDVSASMLAEDLAPNRLTQAKRELGLLIENLEGDRVGLVAFAGEAFLQCPLTLDRAAARSLLELFDPGLIPTPGTDLAAALTTALDAFPPGSRQYRAVVLLTDGEDHSGRLADAVKRAADEGARIFAVGLGSPAGEVIPVRDEQGNLTEYKKDKKGGTVVSKLGEAALRDMAAETGGAYYRASPGEAEMDRLLSDLAHLEKKTLEDRVADRRQDRSAWPLAAALALMLLEFLWPERGGPFRLLRESWRNARVPRMGALSLILIALLSARLNAMGRSPRGDDPVVRGWRERAEKKPGDADVQGNLGRALYRSEDFAGAADAFDRAKTLSTGPINRSEAAYNAGNALARAQKFQDALERYKEAMRLRPEDEDAKNNYELVRRWMKKGGDGGQKKEDKKEERGEKDGRAPREKPSAVPPRKEGDLSKEDAERILQAVERQEKDARRKVRTSPSRKTTEEDW